MEFKIVKDKDKEQSNKQGKFHSLVEQPKWTLEEVALSQNTLDKIDEMIAYIQNREKLGSTSQAMLNY